MVTGLHNNVQGHRIANVCKQTYDASCMVIRVPAERVVDLSEPAINSC